MGTEERVEYLEGEMARYAESLEVLSRQFNLMQHFIQIQFGSKFEKFYESQQPESKGRQQLQKLQNGSYETDPDDYDEQGQEDVEVKIETYDDEEEENESAAADIDIYEDEDEEDEEESVACPSQMVAVQFEDDDEEDVEMVEPVRRPPRPTQNGSRQNPTNMYQQPKALAQPSQIQNPSSQSIAPRRTTRPPPPLLRRPPPTPVSNSSRNAVATTTTTSNGQNVNPRFQRTNNGHGGILKINHDELQGTGNGKYAKYYKKVDSELIQCKICNKILKRRGKFIQHLRTHTGEKPFCCEFCGASFSRKDNMNVHMTRHHSGQGQDPPKVISCQLCKSQFRSQAEFATHLQRTHGYTADEEGVDYEEDGQGYYDDDEEEDEDVLVFNA